MGDGPVVGAGIDEGLEETSVPKEPRISSLPEREETGVFVEERGEVGGGGGRGGRFGEDGGEEGGGGG